MSCTPQHKVTSGGQEQNLVLQSTTTPGQFDPTPPQLNLVLQSPTTLGQFDMQQNADVPRSGVPPHSLVIKPSGTEHYYTR